ncbi:MAG: hypothetical protein NZ928_07415 [Endomicrobia bacterium]|nr:hypothetical protein [Endomicrobiia bacterium]MDW8056156.1 hypothetical protein [Elusimicrobiota bacterium]
MPDKNVLELFNNAKNILIYSYARIGDAALTLILVDNLGYYHSTKRIFLLCSERNFEIFKYNKYVSEIFI